MKQNRITRRRLLATAGTVLAGGIAGCETPVGSQTGTPDENDPVADPGVIDGIPTGSAEGNAFTQVYEETVDSVVLIRATSSQGQGQGSGFVFQPSESTPPDGRQYLITNEHVAGGADELEVLYSREDWRTAELTATDYYSDLAVVEVDDPPEYASSVPLVEQEPPVGTRIVAMGNPFGLDKSISTGIISGTNRSMDVNYNQPGGFSIPDAVQTDAALNPGNSGGPMLTLDGRVVGVVRAGRGDNIGFGISAALTQRVATSLIEDGEYEHSYMGVGLSPVSPTIADANDLDTTRGVIVTSIREGGPSDGVLQESTESDQSGVTVPVGGDVITALDGTDVATLNELSTFLALETAPGETIPVTVIRDGEEQTVDLELGTRPEPPN
jgi:S1-C subfamily serine protease